VPGTARRKTSLALKQRRQRDWCARQRLRDPITYFQVPVPQSTLHSLIAELKVERAAGDRVISDAEWRKLIGLLLSEIIIKAAKKK
jgi:hypothetical protein